jgi:peptidoglycan/xylan/chitin deacetylase (PgdA/CDA1 family)
MLHKALRGLAGRARLALPDRPAAWLRRRLPRSFGTHRLKYTSVVREQQMVRAGTVLRRVGAGAVATRLQPRDNIRVTLSHHVAPTEQDNFGRLVDQLRAERAVLDGGELVAAYAGGPSDALAGRSVAFSFDDGLMSSFDAAQAILNPRGIKAIFFVPTMILDLQTPDEMRDFFRRQVYRRPSGTLPEHKYMTMSADHLKELRDQGHVVLPHTHTHISLLDVRTEQDIDRELRTPRLILEELLQRPNEGFAFPFGTDQVVAATAYEAIRRHYAVCFTGLGGVNRARTDRHTLYRDCVHPHYRPEHVANVSAGVFDLYYTHKMRRLRRRIAPRPA